MFGALVSEGLRFGGNDSTHPGCTHLREGQSPPPRVEGVPGEPEGCRVGLQGVGSVGWVENTS